MPHLRPIKEIDIKEYSSIHSWMRRNFGTPKICEMENCKGISKFFDWALIKGKNHERNRNNYLRLCRKCHINYDWTEKKTKRLFDISHGEKSNLLRSKTMKGVSRPEEVKEKISLNSGKPVRLIEKNGKVTDFRSASEASRQTGELVATISYVATGKYHLSARGNKYIYI